MEGEDSVDGGLVKRLSIDCKATVKIGGYSRGGKTRCDSRAADHDMGCEEKNVPFGVVDEDGGALYLTFGSSFKTSDFIADSLMSWWESTPAQEGAAIAQIQIKVDNGTESSGVPNKKGQNMCIYLSFSTTLSPNSTVLIMMTPLPGLDRSAVE